MREVDRYISWSRSLSEGRRARPVDRLRAYGRWAVRLAAGVGRGAAGDETRSLADAWQALQAAPGSFLVLELTATGAEGVIERLPALERQFPLARAAVVAGRRLAVYELVAREAGAVGFSVPAVGCGRWSTPYAAICWPCRKARSV